MLLSNAFFDLLLEKEGFSTTIEPVYHSQKLQWTVLTDDKSFFSFLDDISSSPSMNVRSCTYFVISLHKDKHKQHGVYGVQKLRKAMTT